MSFSSAIGKLWASPITLVGLLVGLLAWPLGARPTRGHNAIQFLCFPFGSGALTLGNVVLYARCEPHECACLYGSKDVLQFGLHEQAHTHQYERLGVFFLPLYFCVGGIAARNPLEQAANTFARGGHFWPAGWWWLR
ncbi:MAG: hypothetical protein Q7J29_00390 [Stagnimonas sp.]|nr:hypothetical protein [Stagnimonas sp.]